jgi:outer membrane protein assembly factor BamB
MAARKPVKQQLVYVGIRGQVVALDQESGTVAWSVELHRGSSFVPIVVEGSRVFAASGGEVTCLDAQTGALLWHNPLKGFGMGYAMIAGAPNQAVASAVAAAEAAAASAAAAGAAGA